MGLFGYLLDRFVLRGIFGQPQFAMIILTIALGFLMRFAASVIPIPQNNIQYNQLKNIIESHAEKNP